MWSGGCAAAGRCTHPPATPESEIVAVPSRTQTGHARAPPRTLTRNVAVMGCTARFLGLGRQAAPRTLGVTSPVNRPPHPPCTQLHMHVQASPSFAALPDGFKSPSLAADETGQYESIIEQRTGRAEALLDAMVPAPVSASLRAGAAAGAWWLIH